MATPRTLTRSLARTRITTPSSSALTSSRSFSNQASSRITLPRSEAPPRQPRTVPSIHRPPPAAAARPFSSSTARRHGHIEPPKPGEEIWVTFIDKDGTEVKLAVSKGDNLLDIAQANDLDMEGACGGSCACSTCHVIIQDEQYYEKIPEPDDDENDMLDLAFGLTETSRLGCQIKVTPELNGMVVKLPSMTRNLQASDFKS